MNISFNIINHHFFGFFNYFELLIDILGFFRRTIGL